MSGYSIQEVVDQIKSEYGKIDYVVHSLANGPEVTHPLIETSRNGYLAAISASAYSFVSMVTKFSPIMNTGCIMYFFLIKRHHVSISLQKDHSYLSHTLLLIKLFRIMVVE